MPSAVPALPKAHSHADSRHRRPLWDALGAGFTSFEVDVWVVGGRLLVGHSAPRPWRTLERLYLDPLARLVSERGCVYEDFDRPITLLLDVKSDPVRARPVIEQHLRLYGGLLSCWRDGHAIPGDVTVVLSGTLLGMPYDAPQRWAAVDGRARSAQPDVPAALMPLRSDCWPELFSWSGDGPMPQDQHERLARMVADAHARGQRVRFWQTPDRPGRARDAVWRTLLDAGVDLIDTSDLAGARAFLLSYRA
jgi:hypothetical protein